MSKREDVPTPVVLAALLFVATIAFWVGAFLMPQTARIGGNDVNPGLHCQEDEVIGYNPHTVGTVQLSCVNVEAYYTN